MCLLVFAWRPRPGLDLVVAANRDEFHERPSAPAAFWEDSPGVLGGRDLRGGGSWLLLSREGRFAAVTNVRDPKARKTGAPSRGGLVVEFATGGERPLAFLRTVAGIADRYEPFNLVVGDGTTLAYFGSRAGAPRDLPPGFYGLSNGSLDAPWPKVERTRSRLAALLEDGRPTLDALLALVDDVEGAPDAALPDTGVGLELERLLASPRIVSPLYGTRVSAAVVVAGGETAFVERTWSASGEVAGERRLEIARSPLAAR